MVNEQILRKLEVLARLFGVALVAFGVLVATTTPVVGVPLAVIGLLFAFRPYAVGEIASLLSIFS